MDKLFLSGLLGLVLLLTACGAEQNNDSAGGSESAGIPEGTSILASVPVGDDPESTTFQTLDGRGFDIDMFAGKKVFVNYWATWCAPCIREIPSINRAAAELEEEGYVFLFASDEDIDTISEFLVEREFQGNFIKLNGYFATYGIGAVPSSWLVGEDGYIITTWAGAYEWDSEEMLEEIRNPVQDVL